MSGGRRVAVTGLGVVAPTGIGQRAFWDGLLGPGASERPVARHRRLGPAPYFDNPKQSRRTDRVEQFAVAAAGEAFDQAGGFDAIGVDPARFGTIFATGVGGLHSIEEQVEVTAREGRPPGVAVPRSDDDGQRVRRLDLDALRAAGPERDDLHRVRRRLARDRLRRSADPVGSRRCRRHRRQ